MLSFMRWIQGYVNLKICGMDMERFLNLCRHHNISLWNLQYQKDTITFSMKRNQVVQVKDLLKKTGCQCHIGKRYGLYSFFFRYRKRKLFFGGILLFVLILYIFSRFLWTIEIDGNFTNTSETILEFLKEKHIYAGMYKKDIACEEIEKMIRNQYFDITWVSAELTGTRLSLHIKEKIDTFVVQEEKEPYHIIADKDGVITSIITRAGTPKVQVGDTIKKKDILVSGIVEVLDDNKEVMLTNFVNADADIYGETEYSYHDEIPLEYLKKHYTDKSKKGLELKVFSRLFLFGGSLKEEGNYKTDRISQTKQLEIYHNFFLPVYYGTYETKQYSNEKKTYSQDEVYNIAQNHLEKFLKKLQEKGIQIIHKDVKIKVAGKKCISDGKIHVVEQLGAIQTITSQEKEEHTIKQDNKEENTDEP